MSGIEVAGLAFGILPLLVETVKSYSTILRKVHTLRHHGKVVKSLSTQLDVQNGIFLNEVRLLLRSVEEEKVVENMLTYPTDQGWTSNALNDKLGRVLQDNLIICRSVFEEIQDLIEELKSDLGRFDIFWKRKAKGESIKSVIKRTRGAIQITLDESRYKRCLASLREKNGDLVTVRSQISALQDRESGQRSILPTEYSAIQIAATELHEALCGAWRCDDAAHRGHYAKLCLEAHLQTEVRLDLAISCHRSDVDIVDDSILWPPVWLHVQSKSTSRSSNGYVVLPDASASIHPSTTLEILASCAGNALKKSAERDLKQPRVSRKRARRMDSVHIPSQEALGITSASSVTATNVMEVNLCQTKNICHYIQNHKQAAKTTANASHCIGYLESSNMYKHVFYYHKSGEHINRQVTKVHSIFDIMRYDAEEALGIGDQLRLAHKAARAMLQYNNTPWWHERWRLRDFKFFGASNFLDDDALRTLHLSSQLSSPTERPAASGRMEGVHSAASAVSEEIRYGINNLTLFFLGVALLEIAHWKPIEDQMTDRDLNDEVFAARRLMHQPTQLGPVYQRIVRKCLQCNFGAEPDLSNKKLQTAVYNDVIHELEDMMETLEI